MPGVHAAAARGFSRAALDDGPRAEIIAAVRTLAAGGPVEVPYVCEGFVCDRRP